VKRAGAEGAAVTYSDYGALWETVAALPLPSVVAELVRHMVHATVPNVFSDQNRWQVGKDAAIRRAYVASFGVEAAMVDGVDPEG
jgi:hypothetical protein